MELLLRVTRIELVETAEGKARLRLTGARGEECVLELKPGAAVDFVPDDDEAGWELSEGMEDLLSSSPGAQAQEQPTLPPARPNRVLERLVELEPELARTPCPGCGRTEELAITQEGVVALCRECGRLRRIDAATLQRLADRIALPCFSCGTGNLRSEEMPHANLLKCSNPACSAHNSWQGIRDRLDAAENPE
ncbi:MAG: hypothetical protein QM330_03160 [Acidobacteriota bacterium]|jgi:hypothetical protein|nr:hypothetical protein [Acidobacteriota bacterium]NLT32555.1 hypothetical protein [Acidobacteriota bacterium]